MKTHQIFLAAALLALGATSCQKEEKVITQFTACMERSASKTVLGDDMYFYWEDDDQVKIYTNGTGDGSVFDVTPRDDNGTWAELTGSTTEGSSYNAIHPVNIAVSATRVTLPAVQTSASGRLDDFPMYAVSNRTQFHFKNLCGALKVHLQQANCTISNIKVVANGNIINGTYNVSVTDDIPTLSYVGDGTNTAMLNLVTAQPTGGDGHDFYICLPAGVYNDMQLIFYQPDGSRCSVRGHVTIERSKYSKLTIPGGLTFDTPDGIVAGAYSVSPVKQVFFAKGNVQYYNGTWRFAEHQYDYWNSFNNQRWDHFGWSTAATTYGMSTSQDASTYSGDFKDWGELFGDGHTWYTLSSSEWNYVLTKRDGAANKYGFGIVNGVKGLILVPDRWTAAPTGLTFNSGWSNGWSTNVYNAEQWERMETVGAAFLPAAGVRHATWIEDAGEYGDYWSSTPYDAGGANGLCFTYNGESLYPDLTVEGTYDYDGSGRNFGRAVRLVQDF